MKLVLQFIVLLIIVLSTATIYFKIFASRHKVSCNTVMLAAMVLSTMSGLIMGTILALTQPFSLNSILSMIIAISIGLILGAMFNLMTTIEGMAGGIMGGLMGAMLGEMLDSTYIYILSLVLILLMGVMTILMIKQIKQEGQSVMPQEPTIQKNSSLNRLSLIITCVGLLLFSGILLGTSSPTNSNMNQDHHSHHQ
ncbi:hypothetical protein D1B33_16645 [Lysinibacillus yapensis]|uniref:Uncharacterized protein n=1 Tax=Ureibacillus yapensis TaxID=2304605 RepID=A0A396S3L0_9BACL|nr:hypothetical protein [Lysinibacillus yapensis]RHW32363.1 hypothetical protein D1B33_16645 [Lysinibacillus yapensis]